MSLPPARRLIARRLIAGLAAATGLSLVAVTTAPAEAAVDAGLTRKLNSVLSDSRTTRAKTGAVVRDADSGEKLYSKYGSRAVMPASNNKLVTAAAAMQLLGADYRFKTEVYRRARVVDGVLQGRLYLKGFGDPTARVADYAALAADVKAAGITKVTGNLIVDSTVFDSQRYNPYWSHSYASDYYAAQTTALTVAPNSDYDTGTIFINYKAGKKGKKASFTTTPAAAKSYVTWSNKTKTTARGSSNTFWAHRTYGTNTINLYGHVPVGRSGSWQITVSRPDLLAGAVFRRELGKLGISVAGPTTPLATPAGGRKLIGRDTSMKLSSLLVPFLKLSNNMHAEALSKTLGTLKGRPGNWTDGVAEVTAYLTTLGVPMDGIKLVDGSGLSRQDRLTPNALTSLLVEVKDEKWWPSYYSALPVAGVYARMTGGTLRHRMNGTRADGNAHAKTGSLTGVTALSGYVTGRDGRAYAFSMISNYRGSTPRPVEDKFVVALANWRS